MPPSPRWTPVCIGAADLAIVRSQDRRSAVMERRPLSTTRPASSVLFPARPPALAFLDHRHSARLAHGAQVVAVVLDPAAVTLVAEHLADNAPHKPADLFVMARRSGSRKPGVPTRFIPYFRGLKTHEAVGFVNTVARCAPLCLIGLQDTPPRGRASARAGPVTILQAGALA